MAMTHEEMVDKAFRLIRTEIKLTWAREGDLHSMHEGVARVMEKTLDLQGEVFKDDLTRNVTRAMRHAIRTAAASARFIIEVCPDLEDVREH
jgi:hypothetical protein